MLLLSLLLACDAPCEAVPFDAIRDRCVHLRVVEGGGALSAAEVIHGATSIGDPVLRDATVLLWVREHRGAVSEADRDALCGLLDGLQRNTCNRRLQAAHLSR